MNNAHEFGRLYDSVCALERSGFAPPAALATIVRTSGSTFRHAGSSMLVRADGDVVCALSGGCPQHDIVQRARRVIADDVPQLAGYNRESGLDVLLEMGCGGELDVLIEPLGATRDVAFLHVLAQLHARRRTGFMATAFARDGAALAPRPRRLMHCDGVVWNDFNDDALVAQAIALAQASGAPAVAMHRCGTTEVLLEALRPQQLLVLVGVNAVSHALAATAASLGWKSLLVDDGAAADVARSSLPSGATVLRAGPRELREHVAGDPCCAAVVTTFKLEKDLAYLAELAQITLGYLGAIGSRERSERMRAATGAAMLHAPAGLDIGAATPQEIALAIVAEIMALHNVRSAAPLSSRTADSGR